MLPVRVPTDFSTKRWRHTFDPSNWVYKHVLLAEVPDIQRKMGWSNRPSERLCGDCIECMLAIDEAAGSDSLTFAGISFRDGANFFREMSYKMWRVWRVIDWHNNTSGVPELQLTKLVKPAVHTERCTACTLEVPHNHTMRCKRCGTWGCGAAIALFADVLLCTQCNRRNCL